MEGKKKVYYRKVDSKGRIIIPKRLRTKLKKNLILRAGYEGELYIYNQEDDREIREIFFKLKDFPENIELDNQGRILIPKNQLSYALIDSDNEFNREVMIKETPLLDFALLKIMGKKRMMTHAEIEKLSGRKSYRNVLLEGRSMTHGASQRFIKDMFHLLIEFEHIFTTKEIFEFMEEYYKYVDELKVKLERIKNKKDRDLTVQEKIDKYEFLADIYEFYGDFERAKNALRKLVSIRSNRLDLNNLGNVFFLLGEYKAAKEKFLASLEKDEDCILFKYNLGMTYAKLNETNKAINIHNEILKNTPQLYILFTTYENLAVSAGINYATIFFKVSTILKRGIESYLIGLERILSVCPPYAVEVIHERWISKEALKKIRYLLKEECTASTYCDVANYYYENGLFDFALDHFREAIQLEPDNAEYLTNYSITLTAKQHHTEALKYLEKAIKTKPDYRGTMFFKGLVHELKGQHTKALDEYKKAINIPNKDDFEQF